MRVQSKKNLTAFFFILVLIISIFLVIFPTAKAQFVNTWVEELYVSPDPGIVANPIVLIVDVGPDPGPSAPVSFSITKPDETPFYQQATSDASGVASCSYTPDMVGTYYLSILYGGGPYEGEWYRECTGGLYFDVQEAVNQPPVASFTRSPPSPNVGEVISFDASGSYDLDGSIVSWDWDFDDGNTDSGEFVTHSYSSADVYSVSLTVTDDDGLVDVYSIDITISNVSLPVHNLDTGLYYSTIQAAIDSPETLDGHTIFVYNGIYYEDVDVNKSIFLLGENSNNTIIDGVGNLDVLAIESDGVTISGFTVMHSYGDDGQGGGGLVVYGVGNIQISDIIASENDADWGVHLVPGTHDVNITDTIIMNNSRGGLILNENQRVRVSDSVITNNDRGIALYKSSNNTISYNTITNNSDVAIYLSESNDNKFYHNNFIDNPTHVINYPSTFTNTWDDGYPSGGNYWSDYSGTDDDSDGIGDASFIIDENNRDNYPLIANYGIPIAAFTYSPQSPVDVDQSINFDAAHSNDVDGSIVSYYWSFGDGYTTYGETVTHSYSSASVYTVSLTVTDNNGTTDTSTTILTVKVPNQSPVADAGGLYTGTVNEAISFDGGNPYDSDGSIVSYKWDFGDGKTSTNQNPTHTYNQDGTYTITLVVTDNDGATDTNTTVAIVEVANQPPVADPGDTPSSQVDTGETISFDASQSIDPDGTILHYHWQMGDGTIYNTTSPSITHAYSNSGTYTVTLTVTDNDGATNTTTITVTVEESKQIPHASFTLSSSSPKIDEILNFDASGSIDSDGTITKYAWNFGDGTSATGEIATHSYSLEGTYTVTLKVTDDDGTTDTTTRTVTITKPIESDKVTPEPEAGEDQTVKNGTTVNLDASLSTDNVGIIKYEWNFGDNTTGTGITTTHTYEKPGNYTVKLTVEDLAGNKKTDTCIITVEPPETDDDANGYDDEEEEIKREPRSLSSVAAVALIGTGVFAAVFAASYSAIGQAIDSALSGVKRKWLKDFLGLFGKDAFEMVDKTELEALKEKPLISKGELMSLLISAITMTLVLSFVEANGSLELSALALAVPSVLIAVLMENVIEVSAELACTRMCWVYRQVRLWAYGLGLFLVSSLLFHFPTGSPTITRYVCCQISRRIKALRVLSKSFIVLTLTLPFAALYIVGFRVLGDAGLLLTLMVVFYYTIPVRPVVGKVVFDYKKSLGLTTFIITGILFFSFILELLPYTLYIVVGAVSLGLAVISLFLLRKLH